MNRHFVTNKRAFASAGAVAVIGATALAAAPASAAPSHTTPSFATPVTATVAHPVAAVRQTATRQHGLRVASTNPRDIVAALRQASATHQATSSSSAHRPAVSPAVTSPGKSLPAVQRGYTFYLRNTLTSGAGDEVVRFGNSEDIPLWGDWDGNGVSSAGVYRPSDATFYLANDKNTAAQYVFHFGNRNQDFPIVGDWDGNGTTTIGVYRPLEGTFYLSNDGKSATGYRYGNPSYFDSNDNFHLVDFPIVGDWNEKGFDSIGVDRVDTATFYLSNDDHVAAITARYGNVYDFPVAGDWDGDGVDTIGVVRGNSWYPSKDNQVALTSFAYGNSSDYPFTWSMTTTAG